MAENSNGEPCVWVHIPDEKKHHIGCNELSFEWVYGWERPFLFCPYCGKPFEEHGAGKRGGFAPERFRIAEKAEGT